MQLRINTNVSVIETRTLYKKVGDVWWYFTQSKTTEYPWHMRDVLFPKPHSRVFFTYERYKHEGWLNISVMSGPFVPHI